MLTTASITCSATSAMFSGPRADAGVARRQREHGGGNRGQGRLPDGMRESGEQAGHGRQFSWKACALRQCSTPGRTQGTARGQAGRDWRCKTSVNSD